MKTLTGTGLQELILKIKTALSGKISTSDVVTATAIDIDTTPTSSSSNLITSGGVYTSLQSKENTSNKTTTLTAQSTNTQYPSAKVVYDKLALKANLTDIPDVINNTTSTSTDDALSANMGKELQTEINNLKNIGRFLAIWDASTGSPTSEPTTSPYIYKVGDYFRIGVAGTKNPATNLTYVTGGVNWVTGDSLEIGDVVYCSTVTASATTWVRQASSGGGTVQDVTFNGTSILSSGIAALSDTDIKQVKYEAQSLTDGQKSQARANIGAADAADLNDKIEAETMVTSPQIAPFQFVKYAQQSLSASEKAQARKNIGADVAIVSQTESSVSIAPNCLNVWGTMASLTITLATPSDNTIMNLYALRFVSGTTPTSVTWPAGITWAGGSAPTIAASKTYEVTILDSKATVIEF